MSTPKGPALTAVNELLLRQVRPDWFEDGGEPSSQAFRPRTSDHGYLSVDRDSAANPVESFTLATSAPPQGMGLSSAGVWGVSVGEVHGVPLNAHEDPVPATGDRPANPAHCVVDFNGRTGGQTKNASRVLKAHAHQRGCLHRPGPKPPAALPSAAKYLPPPSSED